LSEGLCQQTAPGVILLQAIQLGKTAKVIRATLALGILGVNRVLDEGIAISGSPWIHIGKIGTMTSDYLASCLIALGLGCLLALVP